MQVEPSLANVRYGSLILITETTDRTLTLTSTNNLSSPSSMIEAKNTGSANKISSSYFRNLESSTFLAIDVIIVLTSNLSTSVGLSNSTTGVVKEIIYDEGVQAPALRKCVWVDFGDDYTGESFFQGNPDRKGWVPVYPVTFFSLPQI